MKYLQTMSLEYRVPSFRKKGKYYIVSRIDDVWRCDCMDFTVNIGRGKKDYNCKHIRLIKVLLGW